MKDFIFNVIYRTVTSKATFLARMKISYFYNDYWTASELRPVCLFRLGNNLGQKSLAAYVWMFDYFCFVNTVGTEI